MTPPCSCRQRLASASSASTFSALASAVRSRSGEAGLTTKSKAPLRVRRHDRLDAALRGLDDDGDVDAALAHRLQHADAVEAGHGEIEHDCRDIAAVWPFQRAKSRPRRHRRATAS